MGPTFNNGVYLCSTALYYSSSHAWWWCVHVNGVRPPEQLISSGDLAIYFLMKFLGLFPKIMQNVYK